MSLIGKTLGKYKLIELVGKGGMAYVYRAVDPDLARVVAVKVMHRYLCEDGSFVRRFGREAKAISRLQHANIVGFIDFDREQDQYYLVMDYINGGTLRDYLAKKGALPPLQALQLILHLAKALSYAHQKGIIHRDIKPSNIMFLDKSQAHPVLTDFGLARLRDHKHTTVTNSIAGTPSYMSPEALHNEAIDERSDIYSLGIVLYQMVVGSTPYSAETPYGIFLKRINEPLPTPRQRNPAVPKEVEALILKALASNPEQRYQSTSAFCEAIDATISKLSQQRSKFSLLSFLPFWNREPKPITSKRLAPPVPTVLGIEDSAFKSRRALSTVLGISSGLCATAALTLMLLFGVDIDFDFNFNSPPLSAAHQPHPIAHIEPAPPAASAPSAPITTPLREVSAPEQREEAPIIIETSERSERSPNEAQKSAHDPWREQKETVHEPEVSHDEEDVSHDEEDEEDERDEADHRREQDHKPSKRDRARHHGKGDRESRR